ncbi:nitroreductase family protein [Candidatus Woesearchaeota archaeon]|nr:nitroreductase family protein [Candidatus Woesearchaeota archaeon]
METFEAIEKRRSIRKYLEVPVEWEKVGNVLRAAQQAPSAGNLQDWKFVVVTDKETRKKIANAAMQQSWIEKAPVIIVVYSEPYKTKRFYGDVGEKIYSVQNGAAAIENMLIAATDQGLGSCWVSAFDEPMLCTIMNSPKNVKPQAVVTIGYPDEDPITPTKYHLYDLTFINTWGSRIANPDLVLDNWSDVILKKIQGAKEAAQTEATPIVKRLFEKAKEHAKKIHEKMKKKVEEQTKGKKKREESSEEEVLESTEEVEY